MNTPEKIDSHLGKMEIKRVWLAPGDTWIVDHEFDQNVANINFYSELFKEKKESPKHESVFVSDEQLSESAKRFFQRIHENNPALKWVPRKPVNLSFFDEESVYLLSGRSFRKSSTPGKSEFLLSRES